MNVSQPVDSLIYLLPQLIWTLEELSNAITQMNNPENSISELIEVFKSVIWPLLIVSGLTTGVRS